jgi:recombinational DNA repair ATPase RecF
MQKIKNLKIKCFRGIVEQDLPFDGKAIVLFGENGHGKSSFVDALEFFFKGSVPYLDEAQTTSTVRHVPHISYKKKDCRVEIEFLQGPVKTYRSFQDTPQLPSHLESYFRLGSTTHFILRRKYLLDFIVAQPAPRYTQLAALIGITKLDNIELIMMRKYDEIFESIISLQGKANRAHEELKDIFGEEIKSGSHLIELTNKKLQKYQMSISSLEDISKIKPRLVEQIKGVDFEKTGKLKNIIGEAKNLLLNITFFEKHKNFWTSLDTLLKDKHKVEEVIFQQLLDQGKNLIVEKELDKCPLCLQPFEVVKREDVIASIERRLKDYKIIDEQIKEIKQLRVKLNSDLSEYSDKIQNLKKQIIQVGYKKDLVSLDNTKETIEKLRVDSSQEIPKISLGPLSLYLERFSEGASSINDIIAWSESELQRIAVTEKSKEIVNIIDLLTKTNDTYNEITKTLDELKKKSKIESQMKLIYNTFIKIKSEEVQKIYNELEGDFCRYYEHLHPNEESGAIKLEVKRRASAEIKSKFYERIDEDPRGFHSEAHLDSLGLCIFLAFVKKFNVGFPLLVLDDVVSSIDASHRNRIAELLFKEFPDNQFLITTHDNIWFEELYAAQQAFNMGHKFQNIKIIRWTREEGPVLDKYKSRWEDIEEKLNKGEKQEAGNAGRICLEWILDEMTINLIAPVPRKRESRFDVGNLYDPFKNKVKNLLPNYYSANVQIFQRLEANKIFGNLLSHHNPDFQNISIEEVRDLISSIKSLHDIFFCKNCWEFIRYFQDAKIIKCKKGCMEWKVK